MAQGTGRADRVSVLERKVKALTARLATVESQASATRSDVAKEKDDIAAVQASVATLQSGGATLQTAISTLQSSVGSLTTGLQCVRYRVLPVSRYRGYLYSSDGQNAFLTTALDVTDQGQTPNAYAALVNPTCVTAALALRPASVERSHVATFYLR